jgi:hypothetical protein
VKKVRFIINKKMRGTTFPWEFWERKEASLTKVRKDFKEKFNNEIGPQDFAIIKITYELVPYERKKNASRQRSRTNRTG